MSRTVSRQVALAEIQLLRTMRGVVTALRSLGSAWDALAQARLMDDPSVDDAWSLPAPWPLRWDWETTLNRFVIWLDATTEITGHPQVETDHPQVEGTQADWEKGYVWALANVHRNKGLTPGELRMLLELARLDPKALPQGVDSDALSKLLDSP